MKYKLFWITSLILLLTAVTIPTFSQSQPTPQIETITINPTENQLHTSPVIEAPFAFNAVVPSWEAAGAPIEIHLRTSVDGQSWTAWHHVSAHDDWTLPGDSETVGDMLVVPDTDGTHQFLQYKLPIDNITHELTTLSFTFIDSTEGPTTDEMLRQQQQIDANSPASVTDVYPRPAVLTRAVWCIYDTCDDTDDLEYEPVTHLIVHHTVSSNDSPNWASTVRAIYLYHRDDRGWDDIGYNYLIDRNGIIYEGHMNEDYLNLDVIGTHASAANAGSMGTALLGTFTSAEDDYNPGGTPFIAVPPATMLNALADLFAWKADQRNIEIYDASRMVNMTWGLPHIMGHRDVYGGTNTLCPGGSTQDLLPWLRAQVTNRIGQVSPFTFVSEESSAFTKSNSYWYSSQRGCGWQGHAYYTWSTMNPAESTNWGEWQLTAPESGLYEIQVYAPYCDTNNSETSGAAYEIDNGTTTETAVVSHEDNVGLWMTLGAYELQAGTNTLRLTDLTPTDEGVGVWFDDVRFRPATEVTLTNQTPANEVWWQQPTVHFSWTIDIPTLVQNTTLEIATDAAFTNILETKTWATAVTTATHTFNQDYATLYWRVSANTGGTTTFSTPTHFGLDNTAPESSVTGLTHHAYSGTFDAIWAGNDATSGIAGYNIDYKRESDANWTRWLTNTTALTSTITLPNASDLIWFRSQAIDNAGNVETASGGDIRSDQAQIIFNPSVENNNPIGTWTNNPNVLFNWTLTEINEVNNSTVSVATDAAFNNVVASGQTNNSDTELALPVTDEGELYWQVLVELTPPLPGLTSTVTSQPTWFGLDTTPPTSIVTAVYTLTQNIYMVTTTGSDTHSGINQINLEYQADGDSQWTLWQGGAIFIPPETDSIYHFRSQATDIAGNQEPPHAEPDANTGQAKPVPHVIMLPVINR